MDCFNNTNYFRTITRILYEIKLKRYITSGPLVSFLFSSIYLEIPGASRDRSCGDVYLNIRREKRNIKLPDALFVDI